MSDQEKPDKPADEGNTFSVGELIYDSYKKVESALETLSGVVTEIADKVDGIAEEAKDQIENLKQEAANVKETLDSIASSVEKHKDNAVEKLDEAKQEITKAVDLVSGVADFVSEAWEATEGGPALDLGEKSTSAEVQATKESAEEKGDEKSDEDQSLLDYFSGVNH